MTVTPGTPGNNFTQAEKTKLAGIEAGAQVNKDKTTFISNADVVVANTVVETTLIGPGVGSVTIPAAELVANAKFKFKAQGIISDTGNPTAQLRAKLNGTIVGDSGANTLGAITNDHWVLDLELVVRTEGVTGTVMGSGGFFTSKGDHFSLINLTTLVLDTTVDQVADVTFEWGVASASNTVTAQILELESVKV